MSEVKRHPSQVAALKYLDALRTAIEVLPTDAKVHTFFSVLISPEVFIEKFRGFDVKVTKDGDYNLDWHGVRWQSFVADKPCEPVETIVRL